MEEKFTSPYSLAVSSVGEASFTLFETLPRGALSLQSGRQFRAKREISFLTKKMEVPRLTPRKDMEGSPSA